MSPPFSWTAFYIWRGLEILHVSTQKASFSPLPSCLQRLVSHLIDALSFIEPFFYWWTCGLISLYWIACEVCLQDKFTELELSSRRAHAFVVLADTACRSPWGWHQPWVRAPVCHILRNRLCHHTRFGAYQAGRWKMVSKCSFNLYFYCYESDCVSFIWVLVPSVYVGCCTFFFSLGFLGAFYMFEK